jgi:hypothetical protein
MAALAVAGSAGAAVGIASHLSGQAEFRAAEGGAWKPLKLLQRLDSGDAVRVPPGSEAVVVLFSNAQRFKVNPGATAVLESDTVKGANKVGNLSGPGMRVAKAMAGSRMDAFLARPAQSHERLTPQFPGYLLEGDRHFEWQPVPGAASYSFSLFDTYDNVVWSARVASTSAEYPADLPYFMLRRPYVWRLSPFGKTGKPVPGARWGVITFLSTADTDQLKQEVKQLEDLAKAEPTDTTPLVLLAELYRDYGVLDRTLETLEDPRLSKEPGILDAQNQTYAQISRYAQTLRRGVSPSTESASTK